MIQVEVLATGQRVPRLEAFGVDGERRVSAATGLRARPLGGCVDRDRPSLRVGEADSLTLALLRQVDKLDAGAALQRLEALNGKAPVRRTGQSEDRFRGVGVLGQRRPSGRDA